MTTDSFFEEQTEQSLVKSEIVTKYFDAWAGVMTGTQRRSNWGAKRIAYIDLFAGPGRYDDGTISTPVKILEKAIQNPKYCESLVCMFNDKDEKNTDTLASVLNTIPGIQKLRHKPKIFTQEVGTEIVKMFENMTLVPTLFFVDPWGYKGLSLRLINSVLKDWGCDCIFFFNYNRINMGVKNPFVKEHIDCLFGDDRACTIRQQLDLSKNPVDRELMIIEELCNALKDMGGKYTLPFRFKAAGGKRTSHHLIFVSKGFKGYDIMKHIMAKESSSNDEGVASFEYNPIDKSTIKQGLLFKLTRPIGDLGDSLLAAYMGRNISMSDIYEKHSVDTPYIKKNYKDALLLLEKEGKITAQRAPRQKKNAFADSVIAQFPPK